jgi:hypothetical protein
MTRVRSRVPGVAMMVLASMAAAATSERLATARSRGGDGDAPLPAAASSPAIPEALRGWSGWVLQDHESELCPPLGDGHTCVWGGRLALTLDKTGGTFAQEIEVLASARSVRLPGDARAWPTSVQVDGKAAVVITAGDDDNQGDEAAPAVRLGVGRHTLTGTFAWRRLPESLPIPPSTGLVALTLFGRKVDFPNRSGDGELFLQRQEQEVAEEDGLDIAVHRQLTDAVPALLTTRLVLNVSGKAREVVLGRSLPAGFVVQALDAPLPVRVESDGRLRVQLRAGTWTVMVTARHDAALAKVARPVPDGPWKEGDEVWVFVARPEVRVVTVEGVATIDPQQTTLPAEWKSLPAYLMTPTATMTLNQRRRGDADPAPDQLALRRTLWLDFDGGGFTAQDRITGIFQRGWRLSMGPESKLGRVAIDGQDQFITRIGQGNDALEGVEIRQARASLSAESRIGKRGASVPAVGWDQDVQSLSTTLSLPPGWMLAHASGADSVASTWLQRWTLMDLFLLLITGLGMAKVFGWRTGALALVTLGLVLPQPDAPKWIWLVALVAETLARALPAGRLRAVATAARLGTWVVLLIIALPFAVHEVRVALHPALGQGGNDRFGNLVNAEEEEPVFLRKAAAPPPAEAQSPSQVAAEAAAVGGLGMVGTSSGDGAPSGIQGLRGAGKAAAGRRLSANQATQNLTAYDPNVMVQTGPGVPSWSWRRVELGWNGPVERTQRLHLWLVPPAGNLALGLGRIALMALLILRLLGGRRGISSAWRLGPPPPAAVAAAMVFALSLSLPVSTVPARAAEFPSEELLTKLRERLLKKPACAPDCAELGRLALEAAPDRLRLRFEVGAQAATSVVLPGSGKHWVPATVTVDGKPALLSRDAEGTLWTAVQPGSHQMVMEGPLPPRETVQIPFARSPHAVTVSATGWKVDGLREDGTLEGSLQLSRIAKAQPTKDDEKAQGLAATSLPPFVRVERTLDLGLKWEAHTRVLRQTPPGAAVVLEVPLLPGESVITSGVRVAKGRVQVNLGSDDTALEWTSTLPETAQIVLQAPPASSWAETWRVNASPVWHVAFTGIPAIRAGGEAAARVPEWRPWPGEKVAVSITKPAGVVGQTLTIDDAALKLSPGIRSTSAELSLSLRSSRGGEHAITLPDGATVDVVAVNGRTQPLRQEGRRLIVPISPGKSSVSVSWRQPLGLSAMFRAPAVELGLPSVNISVSIELPSDRWLLMAGGPRLGPAVLFWSFLVVLVLVAAGLGRLGLAPLGTRQWILLGLGLSQTPPPAAAAVAGLLLALGWRRGRGPARRAWLHNLGQVFFAAWTAAAVAVLFGAIEQGLLEQPDMRITGNGSYAGHLAWFADRAGGALPQPWVVSAPLLVYRLVMLAWALWLALAVIRWSRWIWGCFTAGDLWRSSPKKVAQAVAPAGPPPSPPPAAPPASRE